MPPTNVGEFFSIRKSMTRALAAIFARQFVVGTGGDKLAKRPEEPSDIGSVPVTKPVILKRFGYMIWDLDDRDGIKWRGSCQSKWRTDCPVPATGKRVGLQARALRARRRAQTCDAGAESTKQLISTISASAPPGASRTGAFTCCMCSASASTIWTSNAQ